MVCLKCEKTLKDGIYHGCECSIHMVRFSAKKYKKNEEPYKILKPGMNGLVEEYNSKVLELFNSGQMAAGLVYSN